MDKDQIKQALEDLTDTLAAIEHERWSHWQRYMHSKAIKQSNGSLTIPAELVERWERQIETPFRQLSDKEKDSDREQVQNYLSVIKSALSK
ncbi:MAG: hypothetical protein GY798_16810 [Hyphomicrobiales bacterium]|nr:hypothetical protein [Hyphomicrobiales bacterium]